MLPSVSPHVGTNPQNANETYLMWLSESGESDSEHLSSWDGYVFDI